MPVCLLPIADGPAITVDKAIVLVGRHPSCDVTLSQSLKVSRKHCCFVQLNEQLVVRDLGSLNGVWLNNQRVDRQEVVRIGDEVTIGDVAYVVQELQEVESHEPSEQAALAPSIESEPNPQPEPVPLKATPAVEPKLVPPESSDGILFAADADWKDSNDVIPLADG